MRRFTAIVFLALAALPAGPAAHAAAFCAGSTSAIQAALSAAASNGEDDVVRIVGGTYPVAATLAFSSSEPHAITISGGYAAGCSSFTFKDTTIDGQHLVTPLYVGNTHGAITVAWLTIAGGQTADLTSGGLVVASDTGAIDIVFDRFFGNRTGGSGGPVGYAGALYVSAGTGGANVSDNLFVANRGTDVGGAIVMQGNGESRLVGNTIVSNIADIAGEPGGLFVGGDGHYWLGDNIVWNNAGSSGADFGAGAANTRRANDMGIVAPGSVDGDVSGELSVDPQFAACEGFLCFNFELARSSPLVDAGEDDPPGGPGEVDLAGKPRVIGAHVDIGAYENDVLLEDGFD
jgi:hypothetical protein